MEFPVEGRAVDSCGSWKLRPYSSICWSVIAVVSLQVGGVNMGGGLYSHSVGRGLGDVTGVKGALFSRISSACGGELTLREDRRIRRRECRCGCDTSGV